MLLHTASPTATPQKVGEYASPGAAARATSRPFLDDWRWHRTQGGELVYSLKPWMIFERRDPNPPAPDTAHSPETLPPPRNGETE